MSEQQPLAPDTSQPPRSPLRDDEPAEPTGATREPTGDVDEDHLEPPVAGSDADHRHGDRPE